MEMRTGADHVATRVRDESQIAALALGLLPTCTPCPMYHLRTVTLSPIGPATCKGGFSSTQLLAPTNPKSLDPVTAVKNGCQ
jgi:hypothetical protein